MGSQFQAGSQSAQSGKVSGMSAAVARGKSSGKFAVPKVSKKGSYGQAKFAASMGSRASGSDGALGARTGGEAAFSGETTGTGQVGVPTGGAGVLGAGVSDGSNLKGNDPTIYPDQAVVPAVTTPTTAEDPWKKTEDEAMKYILISGGLVLATTVLSKFKSPVSYYAAMVTCGLAIAAAVKVLLLGMEMITKYNQQMNGFIYIAAAVMLAIAAWNALCGAAKTTTAAGNNPLGASSLKGAAINLKELFGAATMASSAGK
jgi:hypothetical protein